MDSEVDHYVVLGLPSNEEGAKLCDRDITKAYKKKAIELHPDKRPHDLNAHQNFQKLMTSYEVLKDEESRKLFDEHLRVKRQKHNEGIATICAIFSNKETPNCMKFQPGSFFSYHLYDSPFIGRAQKT
ncbi:hypothetical protein Leryth_002472 [Lithospermum erythrorhizon]|uniref:Chaperone n=1 Tax=Lithospermum erythrorhizon TaxID=34254 RepID=A0AAV3QLK2_LITER|nr:hypothetical protein Leryth_002472 [Lithospermum erythrorhizon]